MLLNLQSVYLNMLKHNTMKIAFVIFKLLLVGSFTMLAQSSDINVTSSIQNELAISSSCSDTIWAGKFENGTPFLYPSTNGGYAIGSNGYGDLAKGQVFPSSGTIVEGALFLFGAKVDGGFGSNLTVELRAMNGTGTTNSGAGQAGPGTLLSSVEIALSDIDTSGGWTSAMFPSPTTVNGDYYVGFNMIGLVPGDTIGLITSSDGDANLVEGAWEMWSDSSWYTMYASWPLDLDFGIRSIENNPQFNVSVAQIQTGCTTVDAVLSFPTPAPPYEYTIDNGSPITTTLDTILVGNLGVGSHEIVGTDDNGCIFSTDIIEVSPQQLYASLTYEDTVCSTSDALLELPNAVTPISYSINGGSSSSSNSNLFNINLPIGVHSISGSDDSGCVFTTGNIEIFQLQLDADLVYDNPVCSTSDISIGLPSGTVPFSYSVNSSNPVTSSSNPFTVNLSIGTHSITGSDDNGCLIEEEVTINQINTYGDEEICMVTVDSLTGKNMVIWEKTTGVFTNWFTVYKQNNLTSLYDSIGAVHMDSLSVFLDAGSNPQQTSDRYRLSVLDECGAESILSDVHRTIHLSANQGLNGEVNLLWNAYEGFTYPNFEILRSSNGNPYQTIGTVANNSYSYTDLTPPLGTNYYRVSVSNPNGCNPSREENKSYSNIVDDEGNPVFSGISGNTLEYSVHPNPSDGVYSITFTGMNENAKYSVLDSRGRTILSGTLPSSGQNTSFQIDLSSYTVGLYFIRIYSKGAASAQRLVKK